jgi:peptidoglycan LD-endopeptidase CwlK
MLSPHDTTRLAGVHPVLISAVTSILADMAAVGTPMFVVGGVRTALQQQAIYAQGRTAPGPIVTECDGTIHKSDHQVEADGYGHAVDLAFLPTKAITDPWSPSWPWRTFGETVFVHGMAWGGTWKHPADLDHVQYVPTGTSAA